MGVPPPSHFLDVFTVLSFVKCFCCFREDTSFPLHFVNVMDSFSTELPPESGVQASGLSRAGAPLVPAVGFALPMCLCVPWGCVLPASAG